MNARKRATILATLMVAGFSGAACAAYEPYDPPPAPLPPPPISYPPPPAPPPLGTRADSICPGDDIQQVGATLPTPTTRHTFRALSVVPAGSAPTVHDAASALTRRIVAAGYPAPRYLGIDCHGVAVAATFERIEKTSGIRTGNNPFVTPSSQKVRSKGPWGFVVGLFSAPTGYYRRIVFLITDEAPPSSSGSASEEVIEEIFEDGSAVLPRDYRLLPLTQAYRVHAYVYEFAKEQGTEPIMIKGTGNPPKGILTVDQHLKASGVFQSLP